MKQVVIKRLLQQEDSTLNRQFEYFAGFCAVHTGARQRGRWSGQYRIIS